MIDALAENIAVLEKANLFVTFALIGLIWTIQLVHYPSFHFVAESKFTQFEKLHTRRIGIVVAPLMLTEILVSAALALASGFSLKYAVCLGIVVLIWLCTYFLSVPCHKKLAEGKDIQVIRRLVSTNWPRTLLWSAKGVIILA